MDGRSMGRKKGAGCDLSTHHLQGRDINQQAIHRAYRLGCRALQKSIAASIQPILNIGFFNETPMVVFNLISSVKAMIFIHFHHNSTCITSGSVPTFKLLFHSINSQLGSVMYSCHCYPTTLLIFMTQCQQPLI